MGALEREFAMSASWGSERVMKARTVWVTLVLGAALGWGSTLAWGAGDSTRIVTRVRATDEGVVVQHSDGRTSDVKIVGRRGGGVHIEANPDDSAGGRARIDIDDGGVHVDAGDEGTVRMFSDINVPAGERHVGDIVAIFGSVHVEGQVEGHVVAVCGSVRLEPGATIDGDVVAIGGGLDQPPGATVNGESVSLGFLPMLPGVPPLRALMLFVLAGWVLSLLAGWLLWLAFPQRLRRIAVASTERTGWSLLLGFLLPPLAVIAGVLLMITVIGIPLAALLPVAYLFVVWSGQIATSYVLGCRLLRRPLEDAEPFMPLFAGSLLVAALFAIGAALAGPQGALRTVALFFPLLGALLWLGLAVIGSGAVLVSGFGSPPKAPKADPNAQPSPSPPGPMTSPVGPALSVKPPGM
jgi:hypothetical protein